MAGEKAGKEAHAFLGTVVFLSGHENDMLALAETFAAFKDQTGCSLADGGQGSPCQTNGNEEADEVAGVIEEAKSLLPTLKMPSSKVR